MWHSLQFGANTPKVLQSLHMQSTTLPVVQPVGCTVPTQLAASRAASLGCRTRLRPRWSSHWTGLRSRVAALGVLHENYACRCADLSPGPLLNSRTSRPCSRRHRIGPGAQCRWRTGPIGGRSMPAVHGTRMTTSALRYQFLSALRGTWAVTYQTSSSAM